MCVRRVTGVRPGLYHYAADAHALERIWGGDLSSRLRIWMPHSGYFAKAAFVVVLTAVLERQVWRYPYARAYRAALAEAGHVCQTFCLAATWRGLAPFCLMGLDDEAIHYFGCSLELPAEEYRALDGGQRGQAEEGEFIRLELWDHDQALPHVDSVQVRLGFSLWYGRERAP